MKPKFSIYIKACSGHLVMPKTLSHRRAWGLLALVSILLLSACGGSTPEASVSQVGQTDTPTMPAMALVTPTQVPTETMVAHTPTVAPTATDTPEAPTPTLTPTELAVAEQTSQATAEAAQSSEVPTVEKPAEEGQPYELPFLGPANAEVTIVEFGDYF